MTKSEIKANRQLFLRRAICDLERAQRDIRAARQNIDDATTCGFRDIYQIREYSTRADLLLADVVDSLGLEARFLDRMLDNKG